MTMRCLIAIGVVSMCASARSPDGTLGALQLPNNARPAMVCAGSAFVVEAQQRGELRLAGESAQFPLAPEWQDAARGTVRASVTVPAEIPAGAYSLEWTQGDEGDRNTRAVYVLAAAAERDPYSQQYTFACIALAMDSGQAGSAANASNTINATQAQFAIVFVSGPEDRFGDLLTTLDACAVPTVVVADAPESVCNRWFGPGTFAFQYGPDGFIAPAAGRAGLGDDLGPVAGQIAQLRQANKTARWTVGLFAGPNAAMSTRNEITLFVDDTIHACIYGFVDDKAPPAKLPAWAGWFEPPRVFAVTKGRATIFAANRKNIAIEKSAVPQR